MGFSRPRLAWRGPALIPTRPLRIGWPVRLHIHPERPDHCKERDPVGRATLLANWLGSLPPTARRSRQKTSRPAFLRRDDSAGEFIGGTSRRRRFLFAKVAWLTAAGTRPPPVMTAAWPPPQPVLPPTSAPGGPEDAAGQYARSLPPAGRSTHYSRSALRRRQDHHQRRCWCGQPDPSDRHLDRTPQRAHIAKPQELRARVSAWRPFRLLRPDSGQHRVQ